MNSDPTPTGVLVVAAVVAVLLTSWFGTGAVRKYAIKRAILDLPNHRSSHSTPTPRGGGAAILLALLLGMVGLRIAGVLSVSELIGIGGGMAAIGLIGWVDDRRGVPARYRAAIQTAAALWTLASLGGLPQLTVGRTTVELALAGWFIATVAIVWAANLFNFMDGIDGIAGGQAATSGVAAALLFQAADRVDLASIALLIAAASIGFLFWNWGPARIFMGDVGSSALGFAFAALGMAGERAGALSLVAYSALGALFIVDTTLTLVRRAMNGERWYEAHRAHAYQRAVQSGFSHRQVSGAVIAINMVVGAALYLTRNDAATQLLVAVVAYAVAIIAYVAVERRYPMKPALARGESVSSESL